MLKNIDGRSLVDALEGRPLKSRPIFSETGLWFTETLPEVPIGKRIAYPDLIHLTEVDKSHSDEIVIRQQWEPLSIAAKYRMIRDDRFKLIYIPTRLGARFELFDTLEDPAETRDISSKDPEIVRQLKSKLMEWISEEVSLERQGDLFVPRLEEMSGGKCVRSFWDWFASLVCIAIAVLSIRIVLVERARSLDIPMPKLQAAEEFRTAQRADGVPSQPKIQQVEANNLKMS